VYTAAIRVSGCYKLCMLCITFIYIFKLTLCSDLEIQTYCLSFLLTLRGLQIPQMGCMVSCLLISVFTGNLLKLCYWNRVPNSQSNIWFFQTWSRLELLSSRNKFPWTFTPVSNLLIYLKDIIWFVPPEGRKNRYYHVYKGMYQIEHQSTHNISWRCLNCE
jgi:hypothetical protein